MKKPGMAQIDDIVGGVMKKLKDMGVGDNTIVVFTTDHGTETFTWPDGGSPPFRREKGTIYEGGFPLPCMMRWPGHVQLNSVMNGIFASGSLLGLPPYRSGLFRVVLWPAIVLHAVFAFFFGHAVWKVGCVFV